MRSLAEALPDELERVTVLREEFRGIQRVADAKGWSVITAPQIAMMTAAIEAGKAALASGDVVAMLHAHAILKDFEE